MSIVDTLIDISHESALNDAEKHSLRLVAKEVQATQLALASLAQPGGDAEASGVIVTKAVEELQSVLAHHWLTGFKEALKQYAHWKDGVQYVGSCGTTLKQALEDVDH